MLIVWVRDRVNFSDGCGWYFRIDVRLLPQRRGCEFSVIFPNKLIPHFIVIDRHLFRRIPRQKASPIRFTVPQIRSGEVDAARRRFQHLKTFVLARRIEYADGLQVNG